MRRITKDDFACSTILVEELYTIFMDSIHKDKKHVVPCKNQFHKVMLFMYQMGMDEEVCRQVYYKWSQLINDHDYGQP